MTREKLENEIEHKKLCIFFTEKHISDPPIDSLSKTMIAQAIRLKEELSNLETQLSALPSEKEAVKTKKKRVVRKTKRSKK